MSACIAYQIIITVFLIESIAFWFVYNPIIEKRKTNPKKINLFDSILGLTFRLLGYASAVLCILSYQHHSHYATVTQIFAPIASFCYLTGALLRYVNKRGVQVRSRLQVKQPDVDIVSSGRFFFYGIYDSYFHGFFIILSFLISYLMSCVLETNINTDFLSQGQLFLLCLFSSIAMIVIPMPSILSVDNKAIIPFRKTVLEIFNLIFSYIGIWFFYAFSTNCIHQEETIGYLIILIFPIIASIITYHIIKNFFKKRRKYIIQRKELDNFHAILLRFNLASFIYGIFLFVGTIGFGIFVLFTIE